MGELREDWLDRHIRNRKFNEVIINYTSYSRKKVTSVNNGICVAYKTDTGRPFFEMKYREGVVKEKLSQDIWSHHVSLIGIFNKIHPYITAPPLVLLSSRKAVEWLQTSAYKWLSISEKSKSKLFFWVDSLAPTFESYDATTQPFSMLREFCLREGEDLSKRVAEKRMYDYSSWNVIE